MDTHDRARGNCMGLLSPKMYRSALLTGLRVQGIGDPKGRGRRYCRQGAWGLMLAVVCSGLPSLPGVANGEPSCDRPPTVDRPATDTLQAVTQYSGNFDRLTPDGAAILTYDEAAAVTRLYSFEGVELAQFSGWFPRFSPDQQMVITTNLDDHRESVYALDGTLLARVENLYGFTPDSQRLLVTSESREETQILDLQGQPLATLPGYLVQGLPAVGDTPDGRGFIVTLEGPPYDQTQQRTRVYDLTGQARFRRDEALLMPLHGQGLLTLQAPLQYLDWSGAVQVTFAGDRLAGYLPGDRGLVTLSQTPETTHLLSWEGTSLGTFPGQWVQWIWPDTAFTGAATDAVDPSWVLTHQAAGDRYRVLTLEGTELFTFPAVEDGRRLQFGALSADGQYLVLQSWQSPLSTQVRSRLGGETLVLPGGFFRLLPNGEGLITRTETGQYAIYGWDGRQWSSFDWEVLEFLPNHQGILTRDYTLQNTRLLALDGTVLADFPGQFTQLMPNGRGVIIYSPTSNQHTLYTLAGDPVVSFAAGDIYTVSPDGDLLVVYSYEFDETRLVDWQGQTLARIDGYFRGFLEDQNMLIIYEQDRDLTRFYCLPSGPSSTPKQQP